MAILASRCRNRPSTLPNSWWTSSRKRLLLAQAGVQRVAEPVAEEVEADHHDHDGEPGDRGDVGGDDEVTPGVGEHGAPLGRGRLDAEAEKREAGGREEHRRHAERRLDDDGGQTVGQEVTTEDPAAPG